MIRWLRVAVTLFLLTGCTSAPASSEKPPPPWQAGQTAYVCGCPMACCSTISREARGRCLCNMPLRKATVTAVERGTIHVRFDGRTKIFDLGR